MHRRRTNVWLKRRELDGFRSNATPARLVTDDPFAGILPANEPPVWTKGASVYSVEDRDRIRDLLVAKAHADPEIIAAALIGSTVTGGDRWSDLDLTFGVAPGVAIDDLVARWTADVVAEFDAVVLFDLPVPPTLYRVFLLPGGLQVDLSFTPGPASKRSPRFRLLFGDAEERPASPPQSPEHLFGVGILCLTHANTCIARGRRLQAEHWIHEARDHALTLACARLGFDTYLARGFEQLPPEVTVPLDGALVRELSLEELRRAHAVAREGLLREAQTMPDLVARVRSKLADLMD